MRPQMLCIHSCDAQALQAQALLEILTVALHLAVLGHRPVATHMDHLLATTLLPLHLKSMQHRCLTTMVPQILHRPAIIHSFVNHNQRTETVLHLYL